MAGNPTAAGLIAASRAGATAGAHPGVADATYPGAAAWTNGGWGQVYSPGTALPRAFESFRDGQFGPFEPLQPYPIDAPEPPGGRPRPRRWIYPVGLNLFQSAPGTEGLMLANFQVQEDYAEQPTIPRSCIEICKNDILNLIGDDLSENIQPTPSAEKAMQGNPGKRKDFESRKQEILDFFGNPDPDGHTAGFSDWLNAILEDNIVIDGVAINIQPTMKKGAGPCGSSLGALALISGDTIKPLIDTHGARPRPPQASYQQIAWGVARVDLMDLLADFGPDTTLNDLQALNPILNELMDETDQFAADQLLYIVQNRRMRPAIYGFSPMAQCLLAASILIGRQTWQFEFFQSGSLPRVFLDPGESVATAEEARQLQDAINMLGGDLAEKHQVIVLPPGAKAMPQKDVNLSDQFDEWLTALITMPFGLSIADLGITPKVAALNSPQASKTAAQTSSDRSTRRSTIPRAKALKERLFDRIIQRYLGQSDMQWSWGIEEGGESLKEKIDQEIALVGGQLSTIDESRIRLGWEPLGLPETTVPIVKIATGVVPLGSPAMAALAEAPPPPPPPLAPGQTPPGLPPGGPPKPGGPAKPGAPTAKKPPAKPAEAAASDTHAAARQVQATNKPTSTSGSGATGNNTAGQQAKKAALAAVSTECEILRRHLRKGRSLGEFVGRALSEGALRAGSHASTPEAIVYAVTKAAKRQTRRDAHLDPLRASTGRAIGALAHQVNNGALAATAFVPAAANVLSGAYSDAMTAGSDHAAEDLNGDATDDWDDEAAQRAQDQHPYLEGFAAALALGMSAAAMDARADSYGESLTGAYEQAYGTTATDTLDNPAITWHTQDDDGVCNLCEALDGEEFTPDDLPGWPGDGDYGEQCEGGPRCRCVLPDTPVVPLSAVQAGFRSWYEGQAVELVTAGGRRLSVTPNHPVLTPHGFVKAGALREGDEVTCQPLKVEVVGALDVQDRPATAEEMFDALARRSDASRRQIRHSVLHFHGDGALVQGDVDAVTIDPYLLAALGAQGFERAGDLVLEVAATDKPATAGEPSEHRVGRFGTPALTHGVRAGAHRHVQHLEAVGERVPADAGALADAQQGLTCDVRTGQLGGVGYGPLSGRDGLASTARMVDTRSRGAAADLGTSLDQHPAQPRVRRSEPGHQRVERLPVEVEIDQIVEVWHFGWSGHVYDFHSEGGVLAAGDIVVHNCWLEYAESSGGDTEATSDDPTGAAADAAGPLTADEAAAQGEDLSADSVDTGAFEDVTAGKRAEALHKAGDPEALANWYESGADGQIDWGSPGDFDACVAIAGQYMDNPEGYCNLRHTAATGGPPGSEDKATKAAGDQPRDDHGRFGSGGSEYPHPSDMTDKELRRHMIDVHGAHPTAVHARGDRLRARHDNTQSTTNVTMPAHEHAPPQGKATKDFSLGSPSGVVMAPFDLAGPGKPRRRRKKDKAGAANDVAAAPIAAGIALRALDTGRILMLQRALGDNDGMPDANGGKWELPGGHIDGNETPWAGAAREFAEEVGQPLPDGAKVAGTWTSPDGIYAGFVVDTPSEADVDLNADAERRLVSNPDGDLFEVCAWHDPNDIADNPAMRHEVARMDTRVLLAPAVVAYHGVTKRFVETATLGMLLVEDADMAATVDRAALGDRPALAIAGFEAAEGVVVVPAGTVLEVVGIAEGVVTARRQG